MDTFTLVVAGLAAGAIILIALGISMAGTGGVTLERLERYAAGQKPEGGQEGGGGIAELVQRSAALAQLNKVVEKRDFGANLLRDLGAADLKLKPSEFLAIWAGVAFGVPIVLFLLGFVLPPFRNPVLLAVAFAIAALAPRFWLNFRKSSRLKKFNSQLPDTITLIANALRAGSSFLQAIELVVRESQPPISIEFGRVIREVNLGLPFDNALENMVRRVRSEDFELMATAIAIQHQVGGNLAEILDSISFTIRERIRIKGEIRTLTAQQRMSGYVVGGLPFFLALFIYLAAPKFFDPMFVKPPDVVGIPLGLILFVIALMAMGAGFFFIRRIVDIEV
jgi:tight adherence protein B